MAGQYSHLQFFRHVSHALLARYFEVKNVDLGIDFKSLDNKESLKSKKDKKTVKPEEVIFKAFMQLPEQQKADMEAEFQDVNAMACEGGVTALIDEAKFYEDNSFTGDIAAIEGFHTKVMWAFLEKSAYWRGATMFLHADNLSFSYWKKHNEIPKVPPCVEAEDITELEEAISEFFHSSQGRGRNCKVEPYRRHNKEYFFAYPEDYGQSGVEWISDTLKTRARHPAFEIIFVYSKDEGSLDIYAPRNSKAVPDLQKIFAKTILKLDTLEDGKIDPRVYELTPVADADFEFVLAPEMGIASVEVVRLKLLLKYGSKRRILLEADTKNNPKAVYDLLEEINPPAYKIVQTAIKVTFDVIDGKKGKPKTFNISYPNSCNLNYDGTDLKIREMLVKSGLEPKALEKE